MDKEKEEKKDMEKDKDDGKHGKVPELAGAPDIQVDLLGGTQFRRCASPQKCIYTACMFRPWQTSMMCRQSMPGPNTSHKNFM